MIALTAASSPSIAPARLKAPQRHDDHEIARVRRSFLKRLDESFAGGPANADEKQLKHVLTQFAEHGGMRLDLRLTGLAFTQVSRRAWIALRALCRRREPPLRELILPRLKGLPAFVRHLSSLQELIMSGFSGVQIDLSGLELKVLDLGEIDESAEIRIARPGGCTVEAQWTDGTREVWTTSAEMPELVVVGHVKSLNGKVRFKEPELARHYQSGPTTGFIMCRLFSLRMLQAWVECDRFGFDIEVWPLASFHNAEAVANHIPATMENQFHEIHTRSNFSLVLIEEWTDFVQHHFREMEGKGQASRHALVTTSGGHVMALRLEIAADKERLQWFFDVTNMRKIVKADATTELFGLFESDPIRWNTAFFRQDLTGGAKNCVSVIWIRDPLDLDAESAASPEVDVTWARSCAQWPVNVVHELIYVHSPRMPWLTQALCKSVEDENCSKQRCESLLFDQNLLKGRHILHGEAVTGRLYTLSALVEVAIAGLNKGLITRQDLVKLLKSPCQDISVLEAAVLAGRTRYVKHFIKLMDKLYHSKLNGSRILGPEDIDEVTALSEGTQLIAGKQILARYQALRFRQKLRF